MVEQVNCPASPPPSFSTWHCTGHWAVQDGGGVCTIQPLPGGLAGFSVTCGACVTIVTEN
jgi:hypothetical protein